MSTQNEPVSLDVEYLKSRQGLLRIGEAVIGLSGIICVSHGGYCGYGNEGSYGFYNFVVVATLILALLILLVYSFGLAKMCTSVNCSMAVFINDVLFALLYLIATILMIITIGDCTYEQVARIFAALFGACGTAVVGFLAMLGYQETKGNQQQYETIPPSDPA